MQIFSVRSRASIEIAVDDFGTEADKAIWHEWSALHPQVRSDSRDPPDDNNGEMPKELRTTILSCLRRRFDHMRGLLHSPIVQEGEVAEISNNMSRLYAIAQALTPTRIEWPSVF